jgi:hypothetical protein
MISSTIIIIIIITSSSILMACLMLDISCYSENARAQAVTIGETTDNQTDVTSNLTRKDIDPILDDLFTARDELLRNNSAIAFDALNAASGQLFNLTFRLGANHGDEAISQQIKPLQKRIEMTRDVLLNNDNITAAILKLNSADTEFVKLTLKLS